MSEYYYLNVQAVDAADNTSTGASYQIQVVLPTLLVSIRTTTAALGEFEQTYARCCRQAVCSG